MRLNKFIALATGMSRRAADTVISEGRVLVNSHAPEQGMQVQPTDTVQLNGQQLSTPQSTMTIKLNKPVGYVCSRNGQGSRTIYELLPEELHELKPVGRLDKNSSGLILLTNDGTLAHELTHPSRQKTKVYEVRLDRSLAPLHRQMIAEFGVQLEDGPSKFQIERMAEGNEKSWRITMSEGRNRQIRRTFAALGYNVTKLHRTHFGPYTLADIKPGDYIVSQAGQ